jgi:hypothetical protein
MNRLTVEPLKDFPDLGKSFQLLKLADKLDAVDHEKTLIGYCIGYARLQKRPLREIAQNVFDAYTDNPIRIVNIVGQDTIDLIAQIFYDK